MAERLTLVRVRHALLIAALALLALPAPAWPQSVAVQYQRLTQREQAARRSSKTTVAALRTLARAYENITRRHPVSGYSDNALWQAAGLYESIFARTHDEADRDAVVRYLTWLAREYPSGRLARQSATKLKALAAASRPTPRAETAPSAPPAPIPFPKPAPESAAAAPPPEPERPRESGPTGATTPKHEAERPVVSAPLPAPAAPEPAGPAMPIAIDDVTYAALPKGDRLIVTFSAEVNYSSSRTTNPDRVFIDLPNAGAATAVASSAQRITGTLVQSVAVARATNGSARLVLQLTGTPRYSTFPLYDPFRLVIDIESDTVVRAAPEPVVATGVVTAASTAPPAVEPASVSGLPRRAADDVVAAVAVTPPATRAGDYSLARQLGLGVSRIVIDPGHGGHDPGATANGVTEADLVLDIALRLEKLLKRQGDSEIVLTRRTDEFIPLEERTAIANREHADMFISIHANASSRKAASGIETFFLDFASNPYAQSVAARENATSAQNMRVLPELVKTIALTNKLQESRELAGVVQSSLVKRLSPKDPGAKDLGVKRAPFVVLIGAQMPSVLAEVSFLTNRTEASLLKQGAYRERIAQALADAIVKYRDTLKKTQTVSARNAG